MGLGLIGIAGETYFRLTKPFMEQQAPKAFVPGVGTLLAPDTAVNWTNYLDFWVTEHTNSLGFLDREPVSAERAASSCHISIIGDSMVEGAEVPVADKVQVRLAERAGQRLPELDITTAAFGVKGSGQFGQLPLYDRFARRLHPDLVVLVFVPNDLKDNSPLLNLVYSGDGILPGRDQYLSAALGPDETLHWHLPDPDYLAYAIPRMPPPLLGRALYRAGRVSWFAQWLYAKHRNLHRASLEDTLREKRGRLEIYRQHYDTAGLLDDWEPAIADLFDRGVMFDEIAGGNPAPAYRQAVTLTDRALGEFQARAARDGAALVILAEIVTGGQEHVRFKLLSRLAAARGIPVINLHDYILGRGGDLAAATWPHNIHWAPQGHQWAAEALLEWLEQNREVCEGRPAAQPALKK